jgi:molybdopterin synthase catalytic subunit
LAEVRATPLSIDEVVAAVRHPSAGGIAIFLGVVRDHHAGKPVARLDYEAYAELAQKEMARILDELERTSPNTRVAAVHRVGELAIGDTAVVIAASAAHREEAFALCRAAIDRIKESVPIWKKEWAPDGSALWVNLEVEAGSAREPADDEHS